MPEIRSLRLLEQQQDCSCKSGTSIHYIRYGGTGDLQLLLDKNSQCLLGPSAMLDALQPQLGTSISHMWITPPFCAWATLAGSGWSRLGSKKVEHKGQTQISAHPSFDFMPHPIKCKEVLVFCTPGGCDVAMRKMSWKSCSCDPSLQECTSRPKVIPSKCANTVDFFF